MAISGNLKDITFADALRIVGKRTGKLLILNLNDNLRCEWFINQNAVFAVRVNAASLNNAEQVFSRAALHGVDATSSFIFYPLALERLPREVSLSLDEIVLRAVEAARDCRADLPNPLTKFVVNRAPQTSLPADLRRIWQACAAQPTREFTASEIAAQTNQNVETVRFAFYQLRALDAIQPVRRFAQTAPRQFVAANSQSSDGASVQKTAQTSAETKAETHAETNAAEIAPERRSLVRRLLGAVISKRKIW